MKRFLGFFKGIWQFLMGDKAKAAIEKVDSMIGAALPIVEQIARLTPTRTDDEIIRLFKVFRLKVEGWLNLPQDQRGAALLYAATSELQIIYPTVPWNQLQSAAQLAVTIYKANQ